MSWRHDFPNLAASEDFVYQHPLMFVGYSIGLIVVYLIVIVPLYRMFTGGYMSHFEGNLLYTGPGGALDNQLGSCRSDRDGGPYGGCGTAEAFAEHPLRAKIHAGRSGFADSGVLRHLSERSRFLGERAPDAVYALNQEDTDAMQAEINAITGDDTEAAVTVGLHQADTVVASAPAAPAAPAASGFSARSAETNLQNILFNRA